jgi:catechol 2,3-dioxygenase-like lactoylglutathione lyase family enzyme
MPGRGVDRRRSSRTPAAIVHFGVTVPDIDRAVAWYVEVLGFDVLVPPTTVDANAGEAGAQAAVAFGPEFGSMRIAQLVSVNGVGFELFQFLEPATEPDRATFEFSRTGQAHICVRDSDVAGLALRISQTGGRQRTQIHRSYPDEPYEWCYCEDPFGNIVEIYSHSHEQVYANRQLATSDQTD